MFLKSSDISSAIYLRICAKTSLQLNKVMWSAGKLCWTVQSYFPTFSLLQGLIQSRKREISALSTHLQANGKLGVMSLSIKYSWSFIAKRLKLTGLKASAQTPLVHSPIYRKVEISRNGIEHFLWGTILSMKIIYQEVRRIQDIGSHDGVLGSMVGTATWMCCLWRF